MASVRGASPSWVAIACAVISVLGGAYVARNARRSSMVMVDPKFIEMLQRSVKDLEALRAEMRTDLVAAQEETDRERAKRRKMERRVEFLLDVIVRLKNMLLQAGIPLPEGVDAVSLDADVT